MPYGSSARLSAHSDAHVCLLFFFNDTATTEIYTLSLHDALPISAPACSRRGATWDPAGRPRAVRDRKSTRLNSSHLVISYAVFCLQQKLAQHQRRRRQEPQLDRALAS